MRTILVGLAIATAMSGPAIAGPPSAKDDSFAVVFVINGAETWIGNTDVEADKNAQVIGAFPALPAAFTAMDLARILPSGSESALVVYTDKAEVRAVLSRVGNVELGSQKDYYKKIGTDLVGGVEAGMAELAKSHAAHKALVVIGDGNDTNPESAKARLASQRKDLIAAGVEPMAVIYKGPLSEPSSVVTSLDPRAQTVSSPEAITTAIMVRLGASVERAKVADAEAPPVTTPTVIVPAPASGFLTVWWKPLAAGVMLLALGYVVGRRSRE